MDGHAHRRGRWRRRAFFEGGEWGGGPGGPPPPLFAERRIRMRRGDIRRAVLAALSEGPAHGYEVITRLSEKSQGLWRPSPGSVYPTLQLLADEGVVTSREVDGKRVYELTDTGRAEAAQRPERAGDEPWRFDPDADFSAVGSLRQEATQLLFATKQLARHGQKEQVERARTILQEARRSLYQMLAED